jgi:glycosyltransferase involved in cell wall biosynthesis
VWAQTYTDYEVIVVNDGSPDDTAQVLAPLAQSGKIRYIEQANGGQASARNRGIAEAQGAFIALLDDDDLWPTDKLAWQMEALQAASPDVVMVYGPVTTVGETGEEIIPTDENGEAIVLPWEAPTGNVLAKFVERNWIISPGQCLIRRTALDTLTIRKSGSPFDSSPELRGCDDWDLYWRLAEVGEFLFVSREALRYRFHANNASRDVVQMHRSTLAVHEKHQARLKRGEVSREKQALLTGAYRFAQEWSLSDMMKYIYADRSSHSPERVQAALEKVKFVLESQPRLRLKPRMWRLWIGTHLALWKARRTPQPAPTR